MLLTVRSVNASLCRSAHLNARIQRASPVGLALRCYAVKASSAKSRASEPSRSPAKRPAGKPSAPAPPPSQPQATSTSTSKIPSPKAFTPAEEAIPDLPEPRPFTFKGTRGGAPSTPSPGKDYPAQLLVYHAGTGGIVFVSFFKLTAIFGFVFASLYIAPLYYYSPLEETWLAAVIVVGGTVPAVLLMYSTFPIVTFVHLALPQWARLSRERLVKYLAHLPSTAILDVTTLRWIWPRVTRLRVSELYIEKNRHAIEAGAEELPKAFNLRRRIPKEVRDNLRWWQWRPEKGFLVWGNGVKARESQVWTEVLAAVRKGWGSKQRNLAPQGSEVLGESTPATTKPAQ